MAVKTAVPAPVAEAVGPRRFTIEEFERISEGIFPEGERLELIDGLIYTKMRQNDPHAFALRYTFRALRAVFGIDFEITVQIPLKLGMVANPSPTFSYCVGRLRITKDVGSILRQMSCSSSRSATQASSTTK